MSPIFPRTSATWMREEDFYRSDETSPGLRSSSGLCCAIWCRTGRQRNTKESPKQGDGGQRAPCTGVGATLLTAGPRAETLCCGGTGAPAGHGKRLNLHTAAETQDRSNSVCSSICVCFL